MPDVAYGCGEGAGGCEAGIEGGHGLKQTGFVKRSAFTTCLLCFYASSASSFSCGVRDLAQNYLNAAQSDYNVLVLRGQFYSDGSVPNRYQDELPAPFPPGMVSYHCVWSGSFVGSSLGRNYFSSDFDAPATFDSTARGPEIEDCVQNFPSRDIILFHYTNIGDSTFEKTVEIYGSGLCGESYHPATPANIRIILQCHRGERCVGNDWN